VGWLPRLGLRQKPTNGNEPLEPSHHVSVTVVLGCVCKLDPKHDGGKGHHRQEILRPLLVAGSHAPKLLETIDQALDVIALFIQGSVKRSGARLIETRGESCKQFLAA
jgi:hypothetical protein